jgi:DNA-binding NarL/FixJ family response regulator
MKRTRRILLIASLLLLAAGAALASGQVGIYGIISKVVLEPNEQAVARMLAQGLTNEQIAARSGFRDKRSISRTNGQIYAAWGLTVTTTDEKVARTRAALIALTGRMIAWDAAGAARVMDEHGEWVDWTG